MAYQRWCDIASLSWYDLMVVRLITTWEELYKVFFTATLTLALSLVASLRRVTTATALLSTSLFMSASYVFLLFAVLAGKLNITMLFRLLMTTTVTLLSGLKGVLRFVVKVVPKPSMAYRRWCDIASLSWYGLMIAKLITTWEKLCKAFSVVSKLSSLWTEQPKKRSLWGE